MTAHLVPTLSAMMSHSLLPGKGERDTLTGEKCVAFTKEIYILLLGGKGKGRELLHLLIFNCFQLKIILCQSGYFGVSYSVFLRILPPLTLPFTHLLLWASLI